MATQTIHNICDLWELMRCDVISAFPDPMILATDFCSYAEDAYHSLSIEGFQVDAKMIIDAQNLDYIPQNINGLAARGYFEAFNAVKSTIAKMQETKQFGKTLESDLQKWYQSLFAPSVRADILLPRDLLGYRKHQVYIRSSRHVPLPPESLLDAMETFFDCLKNEEHPAVRAVFGHYIFVYIHPYMDGNGRLGRFLMNAMLVTGGYPWTIIHIENRDEYLKVLEPAGVERDIKPFARFIASKIKK